ncbi:MAG: HepT-like ribonuclease domain-containing protein [Campylobacterota bacterium]|nr:HepT-like ribonuclease domain-containing protein [Campylobacterota bacterium]
MSKRDTSLYFIDIFIAINKIHRYTKNFSTSEEFKWSELEWDASIRELEIIGEATNALIKSELLENKKFRKIVDFRNIIIHGYFGIDEDEVWDVIKDKLDPFGDELKEIILNKNIFVKDAIKFAKEENYKNKELIEFLDDLERSFKI